MHSSFLPMVLIMLYQILSFKLFENVLFDEEDDIETTRLSIFPAAIGLLACIPVVIAYFVIVQWWFGWKGALCDGIGLILFLLTLVGGIYIAYRRNLELLEKKLCKQRLYRGSDGHTYSKSDLEDTYHRVD